MDEVLASMETFNRWRYVLAIIAATADPARADKVMAALARWNPGAASWVVNETRAGGLTRAFPEVGPQDWESVGLRMRTATQAWLEGLGPLANCFWPPERSASISTTSRWPWASADITCVCGGLLRNETSDRPLPAVVEESVLGPGLPRRSHHMVRFDVPTAINGIWEITRDYLAGDLTSSFVGRALELGRQHDGVAREEARVLRAAMLAMQNAPPGFTGNLDIERLYPAADIEPSQTHRFGSYTTEAMYRYAVAVIDAAMRCYLELSACVTPRFDRTLALRGLMPAEFFGTMFDDPDRERDPYEYYGPREPGFSWLFRPLGGNAGSDIRPRTTASPSSSTTRPALTRSPRINRCTTRRFAVTWRLTRLRTLRTLLHEHARPHAHVRPHTSHPPGDRMAMGRPQSAGIPQRLCATEHLTASTKGQ